MWNAPRFRREEINPRFLSVEIGALFQRFVWEVLSRDQDYAQLLNFAGAGKDGAIDLAETTEEVRSVVECKHIGTDGFQEARDRWREVARNIGSNLGVVI